MILSQLVILGIRAIVMVPNAVGDDLDDGGGDCGDVVDDDESCSLVSMGRRN